MTTTIGGTTGITFPDATTQNTSPYTGGLAFRNRIINGAMQIDQRNAGASVSVANTGAYCLDRWRVSNSVSTIAVQQGSVNVPPNFGSSMAFTVNTTDNTGSHAVVQYIEGFNTADLGFGTATAATFTLSFWVRSSITGTYGVGFQNSADNRSYVATYTINSANTWEYKTITVAGDTSGTWVGATNGIGLSVQFDLGSGSSYNQAAGSWGTTASARRTSGCVQWANNAGATFYITGVQLEKGSTATSFDYRPYGTELALCQRYYEILNQNSNFAILISGNLTTNSNYTAWYFKVNKRASPTSGLLNSAAWYPVTPTGYHQPDSISFGSGSYFYINYGTSGSPAIYASAEL